MADADGERGVRAIFDSSSYTDDDRTVPELFSQSDGGGSDSDTENCDVAAHAHALLADEIGFSGPSDSCLHLAAVADMSDNFCRVALQHVCGSAKRGCIGTALANDAVYRPIFDKARAAKLAVGGVAEHGFVKPAKGPSGRVLPARI